MIQFRRLNQKFQAPHEVQQVVSVHMTPVLSGAILSFKLFMSQWEKLDEEHLNLKAWTDIGSKWTTKYYKKMDGTDTYIISMCESFFHDILYF